MSIIFRSLDINSHWCKFSHEQSSSRTGFSCFNFFLFSNIRLEFLRRYGVKITFFGKPFEGIRWQFSTKSVLTGASIASKISSPFFQCIYPPASAGMHEISRYCLLEYCSLVWHFYTRTTSLTDSLSFTFLEMCRSDSSLQNLVFSSFR